MSLYFSKKLMGNSSNGRNLQKQWEFQVAHRQMFDHAEAGFSHMAGMAANAAARIPQDVYREFDSVAKSIMLSDEGNTLLNDLMPLAKSLDIGKILHEYRKTSDGGAANTTLSGLEPIPNDQVRFNYDGAIVPVHQSGFYREWRELAGMSSENFDGLIEDQEASVRTIRRKMANYILDGDSELQFKGVSAYGLRTGANIAKADLATLNGGTAIDFTSATAAGKDIRNAFIALLDMLRIDNNVDSPITVYVSRQILSNFERYYSDAYNSPTILEELKKLAGVRDIKQTSILDGNELLMGVLSNEYIVPLVGQATSTIMMPRQTPFARHQGVVWSAVGIQVRTDFAGRTGWLYAS